MRIQTHIYTFLNEVPNLYTLCLKELYQVHITVPIVKVKRLRREKGEERESNKTGELTSRVVGHSRLLRCFIYQWVAIRSYGGWWIGCVVHSSMLPTVYGCVGGGQGLRCGRGRGHIVLWALSTAIGHSWHAWHPRAIRVHLWPHIVPANLVDVVLMNIVRGMRGCVRPWPTHSPRSCLSHLA